MKGNFDTDIENMIQKKSVRKDNRWIQDELSEFAGAMDNAETAIGEAYGRLEAVLRGMQHGDAYADARRDLEGSLVDIRDIQNNISGITGGVADSMDEFL